MFSSPRGDKLQLTSLGIPTGVLLSFRPLAGINCNCLSLIDGGFTI